MDYRKQFRVKPGTKVKLSEIDPGYAGKHVSENEALADIENYRDKLRKLQYLLYAEKKRSLLIVLQALDAGGKDGTVNHVMSAMNPARDDRHRIQSPDRDRTGTRFSLAGSSPRAGQRHVAIFNRSHYEDVLVVRVHKLVPKEGLVGTV